MSSSPSILLQTQTHRPSAHTHWKPWQKKSAAFDSVVWKVCSRVSCVFVCLTECCCETAAALSTVSVGSVRPSFQSHCGSVLKSPDADSRGGCLWTEHRHSSSVINMVSTSKECLLYILHDSWVLTLIGLFPMMDDRLSERTSDRDGHPDTFSSSSSVMCLTPFTFTTHICLQHRMWITWCQSFASLFCTSSVLHGVLTPSCLSLLLHLWTDCGQELQKYE